MKNLIVCFILTIISISTKAETTEFFGGKCRSAGNLRKCIKTESKRLSDTKDIAERYLVQWGKECSQQAPKSCRYAAEYAFIVGDEKHGLYLLKEGCDQKDIEACRYYDQLKSDIKNSKK